MVVDAEVLSTREARTLERRESGRNTAAQRSYSRQSKRDLAKRYLLSSLASRIASSGSLFAANIGEACPGSAGLMFSSSSSISGSALSSSAALTTLVYVPGLEIVS